MLDLKMLRERGVELAPLFEMRGSDVALEEVLELDRRYREKLTETQGLKERRNKVSQEIARRKRAGEPVEETILAMRRLSASIKEADGEIRDLKEELDGLLLRLPNLPHPDVPPGDESANVVVRSWGEPRAFDFEPRPHWDLGARLGILDFEHAAHLAGSRFYALLGRGARLERALANFMLDLQTEEHGYREMSVPLMVQPQALVGTGQLPKFEQDMFRVEKTGHYLISTAEIPLTNFYGGEILPSQALPLCLTAHTPCFRSEAGAAGRDTRGMMRVHQFNKVEMVRIVEPSKSWEALDEMVRNAEAVLQRLELPYRVVRLAAGDMGFSASMCYDLEVWIPSEGRYREISSCSNCTDFQARRMNLRYRPGPGQSPRFVHTLNGSGLAVGRTWLALLENHQREDGSVDVPEVLWPYLGGLQRLEPPPA